MSKSNMEESVSSTPYDAADDLTFNNFIRDQENIPSKIHVGNLPQGINAIGVKNLFLTVGKPISINFIPHRSIAVVAFSTRNEAELAIRDLNNKPPYYLHVKLFFSSSNKKKLQCLKDSNGEKFVQEEVKAPEKYSGVTDKIIVETENELESVFETVNYEPSYRIHHIRCDFKTNSSCVSRGRGYYYMGKEDQICGGLQNFHLSCDENLFPDKHYCEHCKSPTTKICGKCLKPYCSKFCLKMSSINHKRNPCMEDPNDTIEYINLEMELMPVRYLLFPKAGVSYFWNLSSVPLDSPCTVVISMFSSLREVFVQRIDGTWTDKLCRLCNDVAAAAYKDDTNVHILPKVGNLCIARYKEDLCYYRAQISTVENEKVNLFFVDFGNCQESNIQDIKVLPDNLKEIPAYAVKVKLANVPYGTSTIAVSYFNRLTSERIPLTLRYEGRLQNEVTLIEQESGENVNQKVTNYIQPLWKKDLSLLSKISEVFYIDSVPPQPLIVGQKETLILSHIDNEDFLENCGFWMINPNCLHFPYVKGEMRARILEYCTVLKDDCYLPRENELCLAFIDGEWQRCANLRNQRTICWLFSIDDGKTSYVDTTFIRKMIIDFIDAPSQAIHVVFSEKDKIQKKLELQNKVMDYMKGAIGKKMELVNVKKFEDGDYVVTLPEVEKLLTELS